MQSDVNSLTVDTIKILFPKNLLHFEFWGVASLHRMLVDKMYMLCPFSQMALRHSACSPTCMLILQLNPGNSNCQLLGN